MSRFFIYILGLVVCSMVHAADKPFKIYPPFMGYDQLELSSYPDLGGVAIKGTLISPDGLRLYLPDTCSPDGGDPSLQDVYSVVGDKELLVFTCLWEVVHSGLGMKGKYYMSYVYAEGRAGEVLKVGKGLSDVVSGYEGTFEEGERGYLWYSDSRLASKK
ncbi:hypothetical protein [Pseudomonas sp. NA-150]|uniref:hypothetical protein n=1 Tax=Pseudomonas sp. NA-150 TaxID=3367525 RepID=UPI0037C98360